MKMFGGIKLRELVIDESIDSLDRIVYNACKTLTSGKLINLSEACGEMAESKIEVLDRIMSKLTSPPVDLPDLAKRENYDLVGFHSGRVFLFKYITIGPDTEGRLVGQETPQYASVVNSGVGELMRQAADIMGVPEGFIIRQGNKTVILRVGPIAHAVSYTQDGDEGIHILLL